MYSFIPCINTHNIYSLGHLLNIGHLLYLPISSTTAGRCEHMPVASSTFHYRLGNIQSACLGWWSTGLNCLTWQSSRSLKMLDILSLPHRTIFSLKPFINSCLAIAWITGFEIGNKLDFLKFLPWILLTLMPLKVNVVKLSKLCKRK